MLNTKLYDYTRSMSAYELNRFGKFMHSPLHNEDEKLMQLVDELLPYIKTSAWEEIKPEKVWAKVMGKQTYNHPKYIRLLSDTVKKLESFLVLDRFKQQEVLQHEYLLEIMNERKLGKHFSEAFDFTIKKQDRHVLRDSDFYHLNFSIQQQRNMYLENMALRSAEKNLQDVLQGLDVYYFTQKLKYCAALLHYKNFLSIEAEVPLLPELLKHLQEKQYNIPAIDIYHCIILSFNEPDNEAHYSRLKSLILENSHLFNTEELKSHFVFAMNYCITKINYGKAEYLQEILLLYKQALANDLLLEEGHLSQWDYKNIVTTALRVKDFKWAEKFIDDYKKLIPPADRDNAYTFNLARYYFYIRKYDKVLTLLQDVKYNDIFYQLDSKTTLIKTYYELGEEMPLYSLKDSFRVLLRRKRLITPQQRENYMNFMKLALKLNKADVKDKPAMKALHKEIHSTANVADKTWLVEKIEEITS